MGAWSDQSCQESSVNSCATIILERDSYIKVLIKESSFNMTGGAEDIEGGSENFLDTLKGALKKLGGGLQKCGYSFKTRKKINR